MNIDSDREKHGIFLTLRALMYFQCVAKLSQTLGIPNSINNVEELAKGHHKP